jgi:hypothetical protein
MPAIGRCSSYGPLNTSRITSAAGMTTIMVTVTTIEATIMVMDTTTIDTTTVSETLFALAV